jgi:hypothetical protein
MKVISTREFKEKQDSYLNMAALEKVVIRHGKKFIRLAVSETVEDDEAEDNDTEDKIDENWFEEYLAIPEEYRCNPFDISPSGDLFWADKRNIEEVNKGIEDVKAGRVTEIKDLKNIWQDINKGE